MTEKGYLKINDYQLFYRYLIDKKNPAEPVLIFLHDSWGCTEMWEDFPEKIAELFGLNALIYDRRGFGKSSPFAPEPRTKYYLHYSADELINVMDALKIKKAMLYGHSDGGSIALIAAAVQPERFQAIMVEGAHSFVEEKGKAAVRESRDKAQTNSLLQSLEKYHSDKTAEVFRKWHETWLSDYFSQWSIVPLLKQINCPVLAFQGENDEFGTPAQLEILKTEIKTEVTVCEISNAAHTPRKEAETTTMQLINDWFRRTFGPNLS